MKKLLIIAMMVTVCAVGQSNNQSTLAKDAIALQTARIAALDAQFAVAQAQYKIQRGNLVRQLEQIQSAAHTNAPVVIAQPSASTAQ